MLDILIRPGVLEALLVTISALGILLVCLMFFRARELTNRVNLKRYRGRAEGFVDRLNYASVVDDGVIVNKNGSLMAAWVYRGSDNASSTDEEREMTSLRINQAVGNFGSGWMIHIDAIREDAPHYSDRSASHFPDRVTAAIDEERRKYFEALGTMYQGSFVVTLTWFPPLLAQRKFVELMFDDDREAPDKKAHTYGLLESFRRECANFESRLSTVLRLERLKGHPFLNEDGSTSILDAFLAHLQYCITGLRHPVLLPKHYVYLDAILCGQEMRGGVVPQIGRQYIQVVAIDGLPLESHPGILSALAELPMEYRWSSRFVFLDSHEALAHLTKLHKKWRQKVRGFWDQVLHLNTGRVDRDAAAMVEDSEQATAEINSGMVAAGYYTSVVVLMHENRDELEVAARQVERQINSLGFAARIETINTMDAYFGSLPGHGVENVRRPIINTLHLADFLPVSSIWTGESQAPCPMYPPGSPALILCKTSGQTPFWFNFHTGDLGHCAVFGPTGAGKSTFLGITAAQLRRYRGMSIFVFDKGMSMFPLGKIPGAQHYAPAADEEKLAFCPLQYLETKGDRAWAMQWIDAILGLNGVMSTPEQRNEIARSITSMHETGSRTLTDFVNTVQDDQITAALAQYAGDGLMAHILDAREDGLAFADLTVFEIEELMNLGEKYCLPVLLYLFRRIERSLHGQPAAIYLDEAWIMLGHPVFRDKIREWLKVMRKANCAVIMATQSLTDAERSRILDVIVESTPTKIFLPNVFARDEDTANIYKRMGLNTREIDIIATALPKREYYYTSEKGRRLFDFALGPLALAFVGATDKESLATIRALAENFGDGWVEEWLKLKGLSLGDYPGGNEG
jgi:type IV secretion/conjugal transfer VirB4 family ATPase